VNLKLFIEAKMPLVAKILKKIKQTTLNKHKAKKQQKQLKLYGKEALERIDLVFSELNKTYFLVYGTLLGAYRDKGFIEHDVDIDIGIFLNDRSSSIEMVLTKYGFNKKHEFLVDNGSFAVEETYDFKGVGIDIFYFKKEKNSLIGYGFINENGLSWDKTIQKYGGLLIRELIFPYEGLDKIEFLGESYPIPKNPKKHLSSHYGKEFMTKDAKWTPYKVENVQYLKDKIAILVK